MRERERERERECGFTDRKQEKKPECHKEDSLVCKVSSRTARTVRQRNHASKNNKRRKERTQESKQEREKERKKERKEGRKEGRGKREKRKKGKKLWEF